MLSQPSKLRTSDDDEFVGGIAAGQHTQVWPQLPKLVLVYRAIRPGHLFPEVLPLQHCACRAACMYQPGS